MQLLKRLEDQRENLFGTIRSALDEYDLEWFGGKYGPTGRALNEATQKTQAIWVREARNLTDRILPWYAAGLGRQDYLADYTYWAKSPYFELHEITLLSLGLEPVPDFVDALDPKSAHQDNPATSFALRRHELVKRTFDKGTFGSRTPPVAVAAWVNTVDLDVHSGFSQMLKNLSGVSQLERVGTKADSVKLDKTYGAPEPREIVSMSKLLTAIAISEFGYDPHSPRSPIPSEIQKIADLQGLGVSKDTIRKYLRIGTKYLPSDWKPIK